MNIDNYNALLAICAQHGWETIITHLSDIRLSSHTNKRLQFESNFEEIIEHAWQEKVRSAQEAGRRVPTNDDMVLVEHISLDYSSPQGVVAFDTSLTDYKHYTCLPHVDQTRRACVLATAGLLIFNHRGEPTYVFASRNKNVSYDGGTIETPPAGYLKASLLGEEQCTEPLFRNLQLEFEEEIGLSRQHILRSVPLSVMLYGRYFDERTKKSYCFSDVTADYALIVDTNETELRDAFARIDKSGLEHSQQHFVHHSELSDFVKAHQNNLVPRAKAALYHYLKLTRNDPIAF